MSRLDTWLKDGPLLTDGAWGTQLQARGLEPGTNPDFWNLEHPDRVEEVARGYVEAGSQIILTNTFRSNAVAMSDVSRSTLQDLNRAGVEISRRAAGDRSRVVASLGPSGKLLVSGDVTEAEIEDAFAAQAEALRGADALLLETMSELNEAVAALRAARAAGLPVIVSFAFDTGRAKDRTMTGATPEQVARAMEEAGAGAVGANCGAGVESFAAVCSRMRAACKLPLWIKPNAGLPVIVDGRIEYRTSPGAFAAHAPKLVAAGASFLGACCGSNPDFIRALSMELKSCGSA